MHTIPGTSTAARSGGSTPMGWPATCCARCIQYLVHLQHLCLVVLPLWDGQHLVVLDDTIPGTSTASRSVTTSSSIPSVAFLHTSVNCSLSTSVGNWRRKESTSQSTAPLTPGLR